MLKGKGGGDGWSWKKGGTDLLHSNQTYQLVSAHCVQCQGNKGTLHFKTPMIWS